ncbi:MAG: hypothetical protein H6Q11_1270, partial [Acidobacteria bacterium]|nr:hypothetical protein [Acidobacteriota bacterium]
FRSRLGVCGFVTMATIVAGFTAGMVVLAASDAG